MNIANKFIFLQSELRKQ